MKTPNEFHEECLNAFVEVVQRFGYANFGPKTDEVMARQAEASVRELLKFRPLIKMFANNPPVYYYYINGLAFAMGVVLGMLRLNAPDKFAERDLIARLVNDPENSAHDLAFHTLQQFGLDPEIYNQMVQELYKKFQELNDPYVGVKEPRDYALAAFYASFLTGSTISLERYEMKKAEKAMVMKPAEENPAEENPAEEKPADEKKPAAKKPAAKKPAAKKPAAKKPAAKKTAAKTEKK